jgi:hypothetical protein
MLFNSIEFIVGFLPVILDFGGGTVSGFAETFILLSFGFGIVLLARNLYEISYPTRLAFLVPSFAFTVKKVLFSAAAMLFLYLGF